MNDRINLSEYNILRKLKYLQEQEDKKQILKYSQAKAYLAGKKEIDFNDKKVPVDIGSPKEAEAIIDDVEADAVKETFKLDYTQIRKLIKEAILKYTERSD